MMPNGIRTKTLRLALGATALTAMAGVAAADQQILDDLIVDGSACIGLDCVNGESFGFDTLRLKENNLRINFADTSTSASFPTRDWRIVANDSSNGGASYLAFEDSDFSRLTFRVFSGAPANSLTVDSAGDVGLGIENAVVELHIRDGDTPTLRLEQDGSAGFTPQTWDVAGNETNFFVRDATSGSTLPFRIQTGGAPTNSIYIASDGDIGMGTNSPGPDLHVLAGGSPIASDTTTLGMFQNSANAADNARISIVSGNTGNGQLAFGDTDSEFAGRIRYFHNDNHMDFLINGSTEVLRMFSSGANTLTTATSAAVLTSAGVWQDASSRSLKQNIRTLGLEEARRTLEGLEPVTFNYIKEPDEVTVGFIAEDVPDLVATASRQTLSSLDIVAVLTAVVKEQEARMESLEQDNAELKAQISEIETLMKLIATR